MRIAFYGSSLLSAYWNGAATYYRGLLSRARRARPRRHLLRARRLRPAEQHRDIDPPDWARVVVWPATEAAARAVAAEAAEADVVVKASGVGVFDDLLLDGDRWPPPAPRRSASSGTSTPRRRSPRSRGDPGHPLRRALPALDLVLTYGGGPPVVDAYARLGAALRADLQRPRPRRPTTRSPPDPAFAADLAFLANRLPDREARVERLLPRRPPRACPSGASCSAATAGTTSRCSANVRRLGHVGTGQHNAFNCLAAAPCSTSPATAWPTIGFSPATRVFEAAGAGACLITDAWEGIELFLDARTRRSSSPATARTSPSTSPPSPPSAPAPIGAAALAARAAPSTPTPGAAPRSTALLPAGAPRPKRERSLGMKLVVLGLSLASSWGNGHATTYRALLARLRRPRPRRHLPRARRPLVRRRAPRPARPRLLPPRLLRRPRRARRAGAHEIAAADAVIVGSYVPDGVAVGALGAADRRGRHRLLRHRHAGDAGQARRRRRGIPLARADPRLRPLPLLHRRPDPRAASSATTARRAARRALLLGRPRRLPAAAGRAPRWDLGYLGTYSPDRQPTLERLLLEPARRAPDRRFAVAGPQYPAGHRLAGQRRAHRAPAPGRAPGLLRAPAASP